jgi:hypothetical protein
MMMIDRPTATLAFFHPAAGGAAADTAVALAEERIGAGGAVAGLAGQAAGVAAAVAFLPAALARPGLVRHRGDADPGHQRVRGGEPGHIQADRATRGRTLRVSVREGGPVMPGV